MNKKNLIIGGVVLFILFIWIVFPKKRKVESGQPAQAASVEVKELYKKAQHLKKNRDMVEAKSAFQEIITDHPDAENIASIQKELEEINMGLILSNREVPGKTVWHEVVVGDTLGKIAKKYGTTIELIQVSNHLKSDIIRVGQKLRIWTRPFNVFVDKSQNILILKEENEVLKVYSVSTGENNSTPVGEYTITSKLVDPVWFNRGVVVPPESPENVLGTRWLGFDLPGYGIHGTVEPDRIGEQVTAGCVRMRNPEVEELYSILPAGTHVVIVD